MVYLKIKKRKTRFNRFVVEVAGEKGVKPLKGYATRKEAADYIRRAKRNYPWKFGR